MKRINSILVLICLLSCAKLLVGQNTKNKIQIGLSTSIHTFSTNEQFTLGTGQSFGAWLAIPLPNSSRLNFTLAHRQLNGYQQQAFELTESVFPTQIHQTMRVNQLLGFSFWDVDVSWSTALTKNNRWRWGGGVKLAALDRVRGEDNTVTLVVEGELSPTETSPGYDYEPAILRFEGAPLYQEFAPLDLGAFLQVSYELMKGLTGTATYYQGGINLFGDTQYPGQSSHRLSQFSIGVMARIY